MSPTNGRTERRKSGYRGLDIRSAPLRCWQGLEALESRVLMSADLVGAFNPERLPDSSQSLTPGESGTIQVIVSNIGDQKAQGVFGIHVYLTDGANTYLVGKAQNQNLNLAAGGASKGFNVKVAAPLDLPAGSYTLRAEVNAGYSMAEATHDNNFANAPAPLRFVWQFGEVGDRKNVKLTLKDSDGTLVTFSVSGWGTGTVGTASGGTFRVDMANTYGSKLSSVTVTTTRSKSLTDDGLVKLREFYVPGNLAKFTAKTADLCGSIDADGTIGAIEMNDIEWGSVNLDGRVPSTAQPTMKFKRINLASVNSTRPIKSFTATDWTRGTPTDHLQAPSLGTLTITGDKKHGVTGDMQVEVLLTDLSIATSLAKMTVAGWLDGAHVHTARDIGTVMVGGLVEAKVFAGLSGDSLPLSAANFPPQHATLKSMTVKGLIKGADSVIASDIAAWSVGTVSLKNIKSGNSGSAFGMAMTSIQSFKLVQADGAMYSATTDLPDSWDFKAYLFQPE